MAVLAPLRERDGGVSQAWQAAERCRAHMEWPMMDDCERPCSLIKALTSLAMEV
jgi:hypothetical protein